LHEGNTKTFEANRNFSTCEGNFSARQNQKYKRIFGG